MPKAAPKKPLAERIVEADTKANTWLADGNAYSEEGNQRKADECFKKAQFWLDRYNLLTERGERPAPKR